MMCALTVDLDFVGRRLKMMMLKMNVIMIVMAQPWWTFLKRLSCHPQLTMRGNESEWLFNF